MIDIDESTLTEALTAFPELAPATTATPVSGGLINRTYAVDTPGGRFILQRVSPIFRPEIHENIAAVTERLRARGEATPRLLESAQRRPWAELGERGVWRAMTRLPGVSLATLAGPEQARSAGARVARFHSALADLGHTFKALRLGVHDTPAHLGRLREALQARPDHRLHAPVRALAERIFAGVAALPEPGEQPLWVAHGDLKISNLLFDEAGVEAQALVDLDTVGRMPLWQELGDAWRSWCNPGGEDQTASRFDADLFAASLDGWLGALSAPLSLAERRALVVGVDWISVELAARFAADALLESYFGWDRQRFPAAGEHNLLRAEGQLALFDAAREAREAREVLLLR